MRPRGEIATLIEIGSCHEMGSVFVTPPARSPTEMLYSMVLSTGPSSVKSRFVFFMYWYMYRLDASHRCLVVNKESPFVAVHFVAFVVVPVARIHRTVVGIHRTRRLVILSSSRSHTIILLISSFQIAAWATGESAQSILVGLDGVLCGRGQHWDPICGGFRGRLLD